MSEKQFKTATEALREAIATDERSYAEIARQTGITRQSLMGFAGGERSLRLDLADRLMEFYGMTVRLGSDTRSKNRSEKVRKAKVAPEWLRVGDTLQGAVFDEDRIYRYALWRRWVDRAPLSRMVAFIGLNPSTADETADDPTIRRCVGFAKAWGYGGLVMLNLFAVRQTDPKAMKRFSDPVGPLGDSILSQVCRQAGMCVCCWGAEGGFRERDQAVRSLLRDADAELQVFGLTRAGHPKHPLYLRKDTKPFAWV